MIPTMMMIPTTMIRMARRIKCTVPMVGYMLCAPMGLGESGATLLKNDLQLQYRLITIVVICFSSLENSSSL